MHYLDYAATAPVLEEALEAMLPYLKDHYGNPSSVYAAGRTAKKGVEEAREQVAGAIGAQPSEIIFTGGGTESDNLAIKGVAHKMKAHGNHVITSVTEHHAVLHSAEWLEREGLRVTFVPVDAEGLIDLDALESSLSPQTVLVSLMTANNEVGTLQPIAEVVRIVKERSRALIHTDAVQGLGKIPVDVTKIGVDLASFSAHKIGGPKGTGALFVRSKTPVAPEIHGGGQERDLRSGTMNVPGIAGFGVAAEVAASDVTVEAPRLESMRNDLQQRLLSSIERVHVSGPNAPRLPGTLNVCIEGVEGESLLLMLDREDVAASSGSACTSGSLDPSHVLMAMGIPPERALGSLRFSLGRDTQAGSIDHVCKVLPPIVDRLRSLAPAQAL